MSIVFFLPPLDFLEWDFRRWLVLSTGDPALWTPVLRVGRFLYKNLMFFSLPVVLWACFLCLSALFHKQKPTLPRPDSLSWLSLAVILSVEIMFLRIPIEMEYLLPLLPFALILIGKALPNHPLDQPGAFAHPQPDQRGHLWIVAGARLPVAGYRHSIVFAQALK